MRRGSVASTAGFARRRSRTAPQAAAASASTTAAAHRRARGRTVRETAAFRARGGAGMGLGRSTPGGGGEAAGRGRVILSAGLTPETVGEAIRVARPWGVDVNSGVEAAPGRKDPAKVARFIRAARAAAAEIPGAREANLG